ncbi:hypothetical protein SNEBB_001533 [Seison nebaliae]|nr:hypothetical protein SNEBB_001533 [Seison nebaliae]
MIIKNNLSKIKEEKSADGDFNDDSSQLTNIHSIVAEDDDQLFDDLNIVEDSNIIIEDDDEEEDSYDEQNDKNEDLSGNDKLMKTASSQLISLVRIVENNFCSLNSSMQKLLNMKDVLLLHNSLPLNFNIYFMMNISQIYRSVVESQSPLHELLRIVRRLNVPFNEHLTDIQSTKRNNLIQQRTLNVAVSRIKELNEHLRQYHKKEILHDWQKVYLAILTKGCHAKKWKFRLHSFKQATISNDYVAAIHWLKERKRIENITIMERNDLPYYDLSEQIMEKNENTNDFANILHSELQRKKHEMEKLQHERIENTNFQEDLPKHFSNQSTNTEAMAEFKSIAIQATPLTFEIANSTNDIFTTKHLHIRCFDNEIVKQDRYKCEVFFKNYKKIQKYPLTINSDKSQSSSTKSIKLKSKNNSSRHTNSNSSTGSSSKNNKRKFIDFTIPIETLKSIEHNSNEKTSVIDLNRSISLNIYSTRDSIFSTNFPFDDIRKMDYPVFNYLSDVLEKKDEDIQRIILSSSSKYRFESYLHREHRTYEFLNNEKKLEIPICFYWTRRTYSTHIDKETMTDELSHQSSSKSFSRKNTEKLSLSSSTQMKKDTSKSSHSKRESTTSSYKKLVSTPSSQKGAESGTHKKLESASIPNLSSNFEESIRSIDSSKIPSMTSFQLPQNDDSLHGDDRKSVKSSRKSVKISSAVSVHISKDQCADREDQDEYIESMRLEYEERIGNLQKRIDEKDKENEKLISLIRETLPEASAEFIKETQFNKNRDYGRTGMLDEDIVENNEKINDFLNRLKDSNEKSQMKQLQHFKEQWEKTANDIHSKLAVQNRLAKDNVKVSEDDICLPALFMPLTTARNSYNSRAHNYFHPTGFKSQRLTQPPSLLNIHNIEASKMTILNLFELGQQYEELSKNQ